jgi:arylsulfatase A-like enzyme
MTESYDFPTSRRTFIKGAGSTFISMAAGLSLPQVLFAQDNKRYNILMIVTDQERYLEQSQLPASYRLPGHEKLASRGITFENHQIASCVCTSSRAVVYTGLHIQHNGMYDNTNFPWANDLSTDIPTIGDMLRNQGYYTAYKGKWHLTGEFENANDILMPKKLLSEEMEEYGFSDYFGIGDIIGHTEGGYLHDGVLAATAKNWLRGRAKSLESKGKPWFMAVNLVNPHDVMYYNTDLPNEPAKQAATAMMPLNHDPGIAQFKKQWDPKLSASRNQSLAGPDRPAAHLDFADARGALVGRIPNEDVRWKRHNNYYLNCIQSVDKHLSGIIDELDDQGLADNTIIIYTSDHGELAGAHGINGKGATAYREQNNVPLIIAHPDMPSNKRCKAVTSHLDLATTLISLSGGKPDPRMNLHGKDISSLIRNPEAATYDAVRPGALYNFNMLSFVDASFLQNVSKFLREGGKPADIAKKGWRPDLSKRGAIRSVFDGRYKFNRYFSPLEHHTPRSIEELYANNDVELFDLISDPNEMNNLSMDPKSNGDLLVAMNDLLNLLIETEVGEDLGQMLPKGDDINWALDPSIINLRM